MPARSLPCASPPSTGLVVLALMLPLGTQPMSANLHLPSLSSLPGVFGVPDRWRVVLALSRREHGFAFAFVTSGVLVGSAVCHRVQ